MKSKLKYGMLVAALCFLASSIPGWAQTATISGKVTDKDTPQAGLQVVYKSVTTGRVVKVKTDKKGEFFAIGVPVDVYNVTVLDANGKTIFSHDKLTVGQSGDDNNNILNIDVTNGATAKTPGGAAVGTSMANRTQEFAGDAGTAGTESKSGKSTDAPKVTKEEVEKIKAQNAKIEGINALIKDYQTAATAKNWPATIAPLQGMIAADPSRWEYFQALGTSQLNVGDYQNAVESYDKGIHVAQGYVSGTTPKDPKNPNSDPAKAKIGMGQMLSNQGSAYLKLNKNPEAIDAYTKAAELDPNPGTAYFNICATQYNSGHTAEALAACDKAITADPNKADAYFIKGSLLIASSTADKDGKVKPAAGTAEALNKYLELAPDGSHATDVKQMLEYIGSKVDVNYKSPKKK
jgi:tetratricopeptide (TPR) repeat protein